MFSSVKCIWSWVRNSISISVFSRYFQYRWACVTIKAMLYLHLADDDGRPCFTWTKVWSIIGLLLVLLVTAYGRHSTAPNHYFTTSWTLVFDLEHSFFLNSSHDYFWLTATSRTCISERLYLCLPGVWALCGGLGAQTDVLFQHSFLSQLPTQHQQIRSVLLEEYKDFIFIQLPAVLHHLLLSLISLLLSTLAETVIQHIKQRDATWGSETFSGSTARYFRL